MDIRELKYFTQVAISANYSAAAEKLYISQPALSKVIQKMERMVLTVVQASELQTVVPIDPLSIKCFASKEVINPWRYGDFYY